MEETWVIADIHGCSESLKRLVEDQIQLGKGDRIYFLGDYIDRGPDSKGVIDYIIQLKQQGYKVSALLGNHEDVLLRCYEHEITAEKCVGMYELKDSWLYFGGKNTLQSFRLKNLVNFPLHYIEFLKSLPLYLYNEDFVFVHAGLNFSISDPFSDKLSMLWIKDYQVDRAKIGNRRVIHGHVPYTIDEIKKSIDTASSISLDNGCVYSRKKGMGNLVALELNSKTLAIQPNVDILKSKRVMSPAQAALKIANQSKHSLSRTHKIQRNAG